MTMLLERLHDELVRKHRHNFALLHQSAGRIQAAEQIWLQLRAMGFDSEAVGQVIGDVCLVFVVVHGDPSEISQAMASARINFRLNYRKSSDSVSHYDALWRRKPVDVRIFPADMLAEA